MFTKIIEKNINKLTINDIKDFLIKENIYLNENELNIIYYYIKANWKTLLYGDSSKIFNDLKSKMSNENYNKLVNLFNFYKEKYKNYL